MIKRFFYTVRALIGFFFVTIGAFILPKGLRDTRSEEVEEPEEPEESFIPSRSKEVGQLIPFKDLDSYFKALSEPHDKKSGCISIVNSLKKVSEERQCPARLTITVIGKYDGTGELGGTTTAMISGYSKNRWQKLRDISIDSDSIYPLIAEMIEAMAQEGWACMNDGADQLHLYLSNCVPAGEQFVTEHSRRHGGVGTVRVIIALQTDATVDAGKNMSVLPQIIAKVTTTAKDRGSVDSSHSIYFHRTTKATTPQA